MQKRVLSVLITVCLIFSIAHLVLAEGKEPYQKAKQTVLGKYVTAKEAYEKWKANPENINTGPPFVPCALFMRHIG